MKSTYNIQVNHSETSKGHSIGTGVYTYTKQLLPVSHLFTNGKLFLLIFFKLFYFIKITIVKLDDINEFF